MLENLILKVKMIFIMCNQKLVTLDYIVITVDIKRRVKNGFKAEKNKKKGKIYRGEKEVESYILKVIKGLSESDKGILDDHDEAFGEWTTVR